MDNVNGNAIGIVETSDVIFKVQPPTAEEIAAMKPGTVVVGFMQAYKQHDMLRQLCDRNITSFAMELVPRISRASIGTLVPSDSPPTTSRRRPSLSSTSRTGNLVSSVRVRS